MNEEQVKKELSIRIKAFRKSKNLTQEEFAPFIDFEQNNFSRLETGKVMPETMTICKLIKNSGIEPNYLFSFLNPNSKKYKSIDFEIVNYLIDMPNETKELFLNLLKSLK